MAQKLHDPDYHRALSDSDYRTRISTAYTGPHDAMDALWWLSHPESDSPSGIKSPYSRLPLLQRLVYSGSADSAGIVEHQRELDELTTAMATDQSTIRAAV